MACLEDPIMGFCLRCCAASERSELSLFDDLIDEDKQFSRNLNPVRLCSLKVDDQIKLDHLHHCQTASTGVARRGVNDRNFVTRHKRPDFIVIIGEERKLTDNECHDLG